MAVLFEDTRQKPSQHTLKNEYFKAEGFTVERTKLYVGDYMFPGGTTTVDTKADIYELASNLKQQHERFRRECVRASEAGYQLIVLVENVDRVSNLYDLADWIEPMDHFMARKRKSGGRVKVRFTGTSLYKSCKTMTERYGVRFAFCPPEGSGARVIELLKEGEHGRN
ncbi:MAG: ERCC4 domain-containing protein [Eggerthellaceae bacterium]|nr:ERCC4 domain-containing protein [Eggerthellaceae bacterium]